MPTLRDVDARVKLVCLAAYFVVVLHARSALALGACLAAMLALALATRVEARSVRMAMMALAPILVATVIAQVLCMQQGDVLAWVGPVAITREALSSSAAMLVGLLCVLGASIAFMRCTSSEELAYALGWMLLPLRHVGVHAGGFVFSLSVAFGFVPVLVGDFSQLKVAQQARHAAFDGSVRQRLASYARLFPPLIRSAFRRADHLAESATSRCLTRDVPSGGLHPARFGVREALLIAVTAATAIAALLL